MILKNLKVLDIQSVGDSPTGVEAGISDVSLPFVFDIISRQLYSNPIGSMIREITSNCLDSHVEAGVDEPIIVRKGYDADEGYYIEFQDFGVGISPDRMNEVYMNYFSSTKRESNLEMGGFGLGSKTPLAYADMFFISTIFDGLKYDYLFHKGENKPTLEILNTEKTDERSGTTIKVFMESGDVSKFSTELKSQLKYFDNVYFDGWNISNDYTIYEGKYYKFRSDIYQTTGMDATPIHICIDKVTYPLDKSKIDIPSDFLYAPIAVKFSIGEIQVTPSREALRYNEETIPIIEERIKLAIEELKTQISDQNKEAETLAQYETIKNERINLIFDANKNHELKLWKDCSIAKTAKFKPLEGIKIKKTPLQLFFAWEILGYIDIVGVFVPNNYGKPVSHYTVLREICLILEPDEKIGSKYISLYASQHFPGRSIYLIRRRKKDDMHLFWDYSKNLGLSNSASEPNKARIIYEYNKRVDGILRGLVGGKYLDYVPTQEWIENARSKEKESTLAYKRKMQQKVFVTVMRGSQNRTEMSIRSFSNRTGVLVYGFKEDKRLLMDIWYAVSHHKPSMAKIVNSKAFLVLQISRAIEKDIVDSKKTIYCKDFFETKFYKSMVSGYYLINKISSITNRRKHEFDIMFRPGYKEDIEKVSKIAARYYKMDYHSNLIIDRDVDKYLIPEIVKEACILDKYVDKIDYPLYYSVNSLEKREVREYANYLKLKGIKLRKEHYLKTPRQLQYESDLKDLLYNLRNPSTIKHNNLLTYKLNQENGNNQEDSSTCEEN